MPNHFVRVASSSAIVFEIETSSETDCRVQLEMNDCRLTYSLTDLTAGSYAHSSTGRFRAPSFRIHRAVPEHEYDLDLWATDTAVDYNMNTQPGEVSDSYNGSPGDTAILNASEDYYYIRVCQDNNQWAWSSPIWVARD
jgi:hypothetical protein